MLVNFNRVSTLLPFITAIFLHGGFFHILFNMWFLFVFGDDVEAEFGHITYLVFFLFAGIMGNIVQYAIMPYSTIPMLGASGAIAGVLGAYFILFPNAQIKTFIPFFWLPVIVNIAAPVMLGYWFLLQLISGTVSLPFMANQGGVAFWAHVGGFITGILIGRIIGTPFESINSLRRIVEIRY